MTISYHTFLVGMLWDKDRDRHKKNQRNSERVTEIHLWDYDKLYLRQFSIETKLQPKQNITTRSSNKEQVKNQEIFSIRV